MPTTVILKTGSSACEFTWKKEQENGHVYHYKYRSTVNVDLFKPVLKLCSTLVRLYQVLIKQIKYSIIGLYKLYSELYTDMYVICMLYVCYIMLYICYVYVICMLYYVICMLYYVIYICYMYVICMLYVCYMYVILCYIYVILCHMYVICMLYVCYIYVICMLYVCYMYMCELTCHRRNNKWNRLYVNINVRTNLWSTWNWTSPYNYTLVVDVH